MKRVAIVQSNYIPWKGYFDLINSVDEFIIYDDMQYTKRDWRNRNLIKTPNGLKWLSIPVEVKGRFFQKINETKIADANWNQKHWSIIKTNYSKAKHFKEYKDKFENIFLSIDQVYLSKINYIFILEINKILNISTKISLSTQYSINGAKSEKLLGICNQAEATEYISGPAAKNYLDERMFLQSNIEVGWMDYSNYPEYRQLYPPFEHGVTILDLIFNEGPNAIKFMKSFKRE
jgi:hypothetical protein